MLNFIPILRREETAFTGFARLGRHFFHPTSSRRASAARASRDRLGGLPFGLPAECWPICIECGETQTFLAQFAHDAQRLDLGREGRGLFLFLCGRKAGCATWDSGANACLVVEPEALLGTQSVRPEDAPPILGAFHIPGWEAREDGIPEEEMGHLYKEPQFERLPYEMRAKALGCTRLGGIPAWIQNPLPWAGEDWRFLGQVDSLDWFASEESGHRELEREYAGPNFGDSGMAYIFMKQGDPPAVAMSWQCC